MAGVYRGLSHTSMSMTAIVRASACCLLLAGCLPPEQETEITISQVVSFVPLGRGSQARMDTTERVIYDQATWDAHMESLQPLQPFKPVDFETEMVFLAALPVPTGGYDLRFELIEEMPDQIVARYRLFTPGVDCREIIGDTVPFQAVRVAHRETPVRFERELEAVHCMERN